MLIRQKPDVLGALQATASAIELYKHDLSDPWYVIVNSQSTPNVSKVGTNIDVRPELGGYASISISTTVPDSGTYFTLNTGDTLRIDKALGASTGSLDVNIETSDTVFTRAIGNLACAKISDNKHYWILAGIVSALGIATIVSGITKANVEVAGLTDDGEQAIKDAVLEVLPVPKPTVII